MKSELNTEKTHSNVKSKLAGSKQCSMSLIETSSEYRKKQVKVTLEFPTKVDEKAEAEFQRLLKNIWLKKFEIGSGQNSKSALKFQHLNKKGGAETC